MGQQVWAIAMRRDLTDKPASIALVEKNAEGKKVSDLKVYDRGHVMTDNPALAKLAEADKRLIVKAVPMPKGTKPAMVTPFLGINILDEQQRLTGTSPTVIPKRKKGGEE